jgi:Skp family chaperone for outer membrane proteins
VVLLLFLQKFAQGDDLPTDHKITSLNNAKGDVLQTDHLVTSWDEAEQKIHATFYQDENVEKDLVTLLKPYVRKAIDWNDQVNWSHLFTHKLAPNEQLIHQKSEKLAQVLVRMFNEDNPEREDILDSMFRFDLLFNITHDALIGRRITREITKTFNKFLENEEAAQDVKDSMKRLEKDVDKSASDVQSWRHSLVQDSLKQEFQDDIQKTNEAIKEQLQRYNEFMEVNKKFVQESREKFNKRIERQMVGKALEKVLQVTWEELRKLTLEIAKDNDEILFG